jgi:alpha-beta hydrolase superfamily lysophospholipase
MQRALKILIAIVAILILSVTMLYAFQEKLIFLQSTLPVDHTFHFDHDFEEFNLQHPDGAILNGIHFKNEDPKGVIVYYHGNAGTLERWGEIASYFTKYKYDVIVMDYRGYGKSTGQLSEQALYEDAQLFYDFALDRYPEENIIVYGRSLGTGIASNLAASNRPAMLLLETPYLNLTDIASRRFPILPMDRLLQYKFPSNEFIKNVTCPIMILHGTDDKIVPYDSGRALGNLVPEDQLKFVTIPDGKHKNLIEFNEYRAAIESIMGNPSISSME